MKLDKEGIVISITETPIINKIKMSWHKFSSGDDIFDVDNYEQAIDLLYHGIHVLQQRKWLLCKEQQRIRDEINKMSGEESE